MTDKSGKGDAGELLTPADAGRLLGLTGQGIRYLEGRGVLRCQRTASGVRLFRRRDVERLRARREACRRADAAARAPAADDAPPPPEGAR